MGHSAVRLITNICTLPFYTFLFIFSSQRPCRQWTYKQAISVHIIRLVLSALSLRGKSPPAKLEPGAEGDRFVLIPPAVPSTYKEITRIVEQMRSVKGNVVEDRLSEYGPHDIILLGEKLGFEREALEAAQAAVQSL